MDASPTPRVLVQRRRRFAAYLVVSVGFVLVSVIGVTDGQAFMWFPLVSFGFSAAILALQLGSPTRLELTATGFTMRTAVRARSFNWSDVSEFRTRRNQVAGQLVVFDSDVLLGGRSRGRMYRLGTAWQSGDWSFRARDYGMSADELAALLNRYRQSAVGS